MRFLVLGEKSDLDRIQEELSEIISPYSWDYHVRTWEKVTRSDLLSFQIILLVLNEKKLLFTLELLRKTFPKLRPYLIACFTFSPTLDKVAEVMREDVRDIICGENLKKELNIILNRARRKVLSELQRRQDVFHLKKEEKYFELENDLNMITPLVNTIFQSSLKITANIAQLKTALYEVIANAIEHGNLEFTYEEKVRLLNEGRFEEELALRVQKHPYSERKVRIHSVIDDEKQVITVEDDGRGFNWEKTLDNLEELINRGEPLINGRGLMIAKVSFDEIFFNERGNRVTLTKYTDKF